MKRFAIMLAFLLLLSGSASAHSGGTDSNGGHYNHSTGEYHYHHGYPAHQHPGGVCPYDKSETKATQLVRYTEEKDSTAEDETRLHAVLVLGGAVGSIVILDEAVEGIIDRFRRRKK